MKQDFAKSVDSNKINKINFSKTKFILSSAILIGSALLSYNLGINYSLNQNQNNSISSLSSNNIEKRIKINNLERRLNSLENNEINKKLNLLLNKKYITKFAYDDFFKNGDLKVYNLYKSKKLSEFALITYIRANPVIDILKEGEEIFQTPEFKSIIGAESDFMPDAESNAGGVGMSQMTIGKNGGIEGLFYTRKRDIEIISRTLNRDKIDKLFLKNYFIDSTKINLNNFELNKENLKSYGISKVELREVIIPRYIAMNKLRFKEYTSESIINNLRHNILAGNAHYFSGKYELSILSPIKNKDKIFFRDISRVKLKNNLKLSAFLWNLDEFSQGAYNAGVNSFKKKYLDQVKLGRYNAFNSAANETKIHRTRINKYKKAFAELDSYNLFEDKTLYISKN